MANSVVYSGGPNTIKLKLFAKFLFLKKVFCFLMYNLAYNTWSLHYGECSKKYYLVDIMLQRINKQIHTHITA